MTINGQKQKDHGHRFAVYSPTGMHIGLWEDGHVAEAVRAERPGSTVEELVTLDLHACAITELVEGLRRLVKQNEDWNETVIRVVGRPPNWTDEYLSDARALIAKYGDKT